LLAVCSKAYLKEQGPLRKPSDLRRTVLLRNAIQPWTPARIALPIPLLDARELAVVHQRVAAPALFDTVLCLSTGQAHYQVTLNTGKDTASVLSALPGCTGPR
jgi:hypothetical protein